MKKFFTNILASLGFKRKISAWLETISLALMAIPELAFTAPIISSIAGYFGIAGVTHAVVGGAKKLVNLHTIAATLNALILAADSVPQLQPFKQLLVALAALINPLAVGASIGKTRTK